MIRIGPQNHPPLNDAERSELIGKLIVVTGASRGLGYATALLLGTCGAQVVAVARNVPRLEELDDAIRAAGGTAPTLVPLDLKDGPAIDRLGASLFERWGSLDGFVGNAGVLGAPAPLGHVKAKDWDEVIAVNLTANWRLLRTLDPLLRKADAGRVVLVTAEEGHTPRQFYAPYAASKTALETVATIYAAETANVSNIKVSLFQPGPMRTGLRAKQVPGEPPDSVPKPAETAPGVARLCL